MDGTWRRRTAKMRAVGDVMFAFFSEWCEVDNSRFALEFRLDGAAALPKRQIADWPMTLFAPLRQVTGSREPSARRYAAFQRNRRCGRTGRLGTAVTLPPLPRSLIELVSASRLLKNGNFCGVGRRLSGDSR
jgi:hypothetical protein